MCVLLCVHCAGHAGVCGQGRDPQGGKGKGADGDQEEAGALVITEERDSCFALWWRKWTLPTPTCAVSCAGCRAPGSDDAWCSPSRGEGGSSPQRVLGMLQRTSGEAHKKVEPAVQALHTKTCDSWGFKTVDKGNVLIRLSFSYIQSLPLYADSYLGHSAERANKIPCRSQHRSEDNHSTRSYGKGQKDVISP